MKGFKLYGGKKIDNLKEYVEIYLKANPTAVPYIGTDSKDFTFVTTICFRHPGDGVHIIYRKEKTSRRIDIFSKMMKETDMTMEVVQYLEYELMDLKLERGLGVDDRLFKIHCDVNPNEDAKSNVAHSSVVGMFKGLGYNVDTKPNAWAATCAADFLSHK